MVKRWCEEQFVDYISGPGYRLRCMLRDGSVSIDLNFPHNPNMGHLHGISLSPP